MTNLDLLEEQLMNAVPATQAAAGQVPAAPSDIPQGMPTLTQTQPVESDPMASTEHPPVPQDGGFLVESDMFLDEPQDDELTSVETGLDSDIFAEGLDSTSDAETESVTRSDGPTNYSSAVSRLKNKDVLSVEDLSNLPFDDIVRLADVTSPLRFGAKDQLARALRGSTSSNVISETLIGDAVSSGTPVNRLMKDKYQEYIAENPDAERSFLNRALTSIMTGSPVSGMVFEDSQQYPTQTRSTIDTFANALTFGTGRKLYDVVSPMSAQGIEAGRQRLADNEIIGDQFLTEMLGSAVPGTVLARGIGLGAQGATLGQNMARGATIGGLEGAAAGIGYGDGESLGEVATDAAIGGVIGGAIGGITPAVMEGVNAAYRSLTTDATTKVRTRALNKLVRDINSALPEGQPKVTLEELRASARSGETPVQFMMRKEIRRPNRQAVINNNFINSPDLMDELYTTSRRRVARSLADARNTRVELGEEIGRARANMPKTEVEGILKEMADSDVGDRFVREAVIPNARQTVQANDSLVKSLGYKANDSNVKFHMDTNTGKLYIVKADKAGNAFRPDKKGNYTSKQLSEYIIDGEDLAAIGQRFKNTYSGDLGIGDTKLQPEAYLFKPYSERMTDLMNEDSALRSANEAFTRYIDEFDAISKSSSGRQAYVDYSENIRASSLPQADKDALIFLAKEIDTLNSAGASSATRQRSNPLVKGIRSLLMGTALGRGFGATLRYTMLSRLVDIMSGNNALVMSKAQRDLIPVMQYIINGSERQIDDLMEDMIAFGVRDRTTFNNWMQKIAATLPIFSSSAATSSDMQGDPAPPRTAIGTLGEPGGMFEGAEDLSDLGVR